MSKSYCHLSDLERAQIQAHLELGSKVRAIARALLRAPSTISRELKRCGWLGATLATPAARLRTRGINGYWCEAAHKRACALARKPRTKCKLVIGNMPGAGNALWTSVYWALKHLSPQQVSGTLARMDIPQRISHETIYTAIYAMPKGELRKEVIAMLSRHHKGRRLRTQGKDRRAMIVGMTSIEERDPSVEDRPVPGQWGGTWSKARLTALRWARWSSARRFTPCWCS